MAVQPIGQLRINLIRKHHNIGTAQHLRNGFQICRIHHAAGGVVGIRQDQQFGTRRNGGAQLVRPQAEIILHFGGNVHRHAAGQRSDRFITDKTRLRDDDFIPRFDQCTDGQVNGLAAAHGNKHLAGLVVQLHAAGQVAANFGAQLFDTRIGGIARTALFQATDARIPDGPRRLEIRFAHAKANAVRHFGGQIKKLANPRRPH